MYQKITRGLVRVRVAIAIILGIIGTIIVASNEYVTGAEILGFIIVASIIVIGGGTLILLDYHHSSKMDN